MVGSSCITQLLRLHDALLQSILQTCRKNTCTLNPQPGLQHDLSRALAAVLKSNLQLASLNLTLGVEVRNLDYSVADASSIEAVTAQARRLAESHSSKNPLQRSTPPTAKQASVSVPSSSATDKPAANFGPADPAVTDLLLKLLKSSRLQSRRLDMSVGPIGFELLSAGNEQQVLEHAARSILYAEIHDLELVFAVHIRVLRKKAGRGKKAAADQFPPWPQLGEAAGKVSSVTALLSFYEHLGAHVKDFALLV